MSAFFSNIAEWFGIQTEVTGVSDVFTALIQKILETIGSWFD